MVITGIKELWRGPLPRAAKLNTGDTLVLTVRAEAPQQETIIASHRLIAEQAMTVDTALLFEGEIDGRRAIGGVFMEQGGHSGAPPYCSAT